MAKKGQNKQKTGTIKKQVKTSARRGNSTAPLAKKPPAKVPSKSQIERSALQQSIRHNMAVINDRAAGIREEEKSGNIDSSFLRTQHAKIQQLTMTSDKVSSQRGKFLTGELSRMSTTRLKEIRAAQEEFLQSKWSTAEGREEIAQKGYERMKETYGDMTREQYDAIRQTFARLPELYEDLKEIGYISSDQVVDMALDSDKKPDDIVRAFENLSDSLKDGDVTLSQISKLPSPRLFISELIKNPSEEVSSVYAAVQSIPRSGGFRRR